MLRICALTGLPVIVDSKKVGRVIRADLSDDLTQLSGLWIAKGFLGTRFIPSESIGMLGTMAITADHCGTRMRLSGPPLPRRAVGSDGSRLGAITGAEINELSFRVESLELSCGLWDDLAHGRRKIERFAVNQETGCVITGAFKTEKEEGIDEEQHDEEPCHRRIDRRFGSDDVRRDELAVRAQHEPADEENRPLAGP